MSISPEVNRINIVFKEYGGTQKAFAKELGITQSQVSRILRGVPDYPVTIELVKAISGKLGYSAEWLLDGTGPKKLKKDGPKKMLIDITDFRGDLEVMTARFNKLEKRLEYVINLVEKELKK